MESGVTLGHWRKRGKEIVHAEAQVMADQKKKRAGRKVKGGAESEVMPSAIRGRQRSWAKKYISCQKDMKQGTWNEALQPYDLTCGKDEVGLFLSPRFHTSVTVSSTYAS